MTRGKIIREELIFFLFATNEVNIVFVDDCTRGGHLKDLFLPYEKPVKKKVEDLLPGKSLSHMMCRMG